MTTAMFKSLDCPSFKEMEKLEVKFDGKSISFWYKPHPLSEARVAFMLVQLFTPTSLGTDRAMKIEFPNLNTVPIEKGFVRYTDIRNARMAFIRLRSKMSNRQHLIKAVTWEK